LCGDTTEHVNADGFLGKEYRGIGLVRQERIGLTIPKKTAAKKS
jgi:hypothetical protein